MSLPLVSDDLWEAIEPLLPRERPKPKGGRPRVPDRAALTGIVFILRTGTPWRLLPRELGCGSGTTCWRRLRDWQAAGVWEQLHSTLLNWLGDEGAIDWSRASLDSVSVRAKRGGASKRPRLEASGAHRRRHPSGRRPTRPAGAAEEAAGQAPCRQGVRLLGEASGPAFPRDHAADRPARRGVERAPWAVPLDRGTQLGVAARFPPARRPL